MRRPAVRCLPLVSMLLVLAAVPVAAQDPPAPPETKSVAFAHIEIKGDYPEAAQPAGLFGDIVESLADALKRLDRAAEDDAITGVVLEIEGPDIGWAKLNELRRAVVHVQKSGKRVYAVVEQPGTMDYLLAAQCDQVIMPESGVLMLVGLQAEVLFYKNLFELLDIKAEMLRVGDYKAAAEPYTRTEMSPEYKQNMTAILDDYWRQMIEMIAAGRKLDKQQVEAAIDSGPHTAAQAKQLGLIDTIAYEDQLEELLGQKDGEIEVALQRRYGKKKIDTDFSGLGGMIKLMNLLTGGDTRKRSGTGPKIAVITGTGIIMTGRSANDPFLGTITMGSETMIKAIRKAKEDDNVKAVVLRVDSPGGSALAS
ncbi:MAG: S49 family peptidase, partial [Planctomycetaceae bacterium]